MAFARRLGFKLRLTRGNTTYGVQIDFGSPIPNYATDFITVDNISVTYFLEVNCEAVNTVSLKDDYVTKIYPNPVSNSLFIENVQSDSLEIELFGNEGKKVKSHFSTSRLTELDISDLIKGVYFIVINGREVKKIIKL